MSATLPNLELLTNNNAKAVRLINNREKYFNHRMFANRVKVNYELLNRKIVISELEEQILQNICLNSVTGYSIRFLKLTIALEY